MPRGHGWIGPWIRHCWALAFVCFSFYFYFWLRLLYTSATSYISWWHRQFFSLYVKTLCIVSYVFCRISVASRTAKQRIS